MPIRLTAQSGDLPLAFSDVDTHLKGSAADAFLQRGEPIAGEQLNLALGGEGYGLHEVTISGEFAQSGHKATFPWTKTTTLVGGLDVDSLARATHAMTRDFIAPYGKGNTPPEIYVTSIRINDKGPEPYIPKPPTRRKGERFAAYLDSKTGEYVPRDKYKHSRAALRGVAKRKGRKHASKGRYVRVLLDFPDDETYDDAEE